ncbi:hypothetical protein BH20VER1_BH20VER1_25070 [soil metagenome]
MAAGENQRVSARATGVVGAAIMCSRILGLMREMIIAALFGASAHMDAFLTAFRAPNMLRDLFAEGALSTAFVTTFTKKIASEGNNSAWKLANKIATLTIVFMSLVVLAGVVLAPFLVSILAPGFNPEKAALTVTLARVMYSFILLVSLAALAMGMLNAKNVFGVPAMASSFLAHALGGSGGECHRRHIRQVRAQFLQLTILGPEIVTPFADAMRLIDGDLRDVPVGGLFKKALQHEPLRRHVEQAELAVVQAAPAGAGLARVEGRVQIGSGDATGLERVHLVFHQGDERRHHDGEAVAEQRRELEAKGLAAAGRHEGENVAPRQRVPHNLLLERAEPVVAEMFLKRCD